MRGLRAPKGRPADNEGPEEEERAEAEDARRPGEEEHNRGERREMHDGVPLKKGGRVKRRRGGHIDEAMKEHEFSPHHPKHHPRKRGGKLEGKKPGHRPDRRARGGGLADTNPLTEANRMRTPDYQEKQQGDSSPGHKAYGKDTDGGLRVRRD